MYAVPNIQINKELLERNSKQNNNTLIFKQMSSQFRQTDQQILTQIVQYANQRYMRQSRLHKTSSFNILRILSAFKQTQHNFEYRKDQIYNWIIYITKNYNPQTVKQWIVAIQQLSNKEHSLPVIDGNQRCLSRKPSRQDRSQRSLYLGVNHGRLGVSFQEDVAAWNQSLLEPISSKNSVNYQRKKSKQIMHSSDSQFKLIAPISSKMHYISFEPEDQNKENMNSANTHSQHLKSDNLRCDNQPTRTPGEQSFIHNLPMSYGSPFVLSKITNNTKQVTEVEEQEDNTEQWTNMKARADIFHHINLSMKVFSALLANFQAFQIFQGIYRKTKTFQKHMYFMRFYRAGKSHNNQKKLRRDREQWANHHYQANLERKALRVLQVYYQLKIKKQNKKIVDISKLNNVNYQFLISLIFSSYQEEEAQQLTHDTPKSLRYKSRYFQNIEDCQKMELISQYFSCNLRLNKDQIQNLFYLYKKSRKSKTFNILKQNIRDFTKQQHQIITIKKINTLKQLRTKTRRTLTNKARIKMMDLCKQNKLKQKCFKAIHEYQLSKKIYMKRQEFLRNQNRLCVMKAILKEWKNRKNQVQNKKLGVRECVGKGVGIVERLVKMRVIKELYDRCEQIMNNQRQQQKRKLKQTCQNIFSHLKQRTIQRKNYNMIRNNKTLGNKRQIYKIWNKKLKIISAINKIRCSFQRRPFNKLYSQFQFNRQYQSLLLNYQMVRCRQFLKDFKMSFHFDRSNQLKMINFCKQKITQAQFKVFMKICVHQIDIKRSKKQQQERKQKENKLSELRIHKLKILALRQINENFNIKKCHMNKENIIKAVMGERSICTKDGYHLIQGNIQQKMETYTRCHTKMKKQFIVCLQQNFNSNKSHEAINKMVLSNGNNKLKISLQQWREQVRLKLLTREIKNKAIANTQLLFFNRIREIHVNLNKKIELAQNKHNKSLKYKTLLGFAQAIMHTQTLTKNLSKTVSSNLKKRSSLHLIKQLKSDQKFRSQRSKLGKLLFFGRLQRNNISNIELMQKKTILLLRLKKSYVNKFLSFRKLNFRKSILQQNLVEAYKKFAVMKVQRAVVRHILSRKYNYMAIKFKAINLCRLAFAALSLNRSKNRQGLENSKKFRLHEHISTSYSSL